MTLRPRRTTLRSRMVHATIMGSVLLCGWQLGLCHAAEETLVTVGGRPITEADLQLEAVLRRIDAGQINEHRDQLLEELIDLRIIASFLTGRRIKANSIELDQQVERIHGLIRRSDEEPKAFFQRIGLTEKQLRDRLALSLSWQVYVRQVTTADQLRRHFDAHRRELDGTQLRARHIIIKATREESAKRKAAIKQLAEIRRQIQSGSATFAEAAASASEGPSRREGGDVGFFAHRGTMSADFADAAFALKLGEVSQPVETAFGVHLIEVTDERPGQLSLEDVRGQVLGQISRKLWSEQVAKDRDRVAIIRSNAGN